MKKSFWKIFLLVFLHVAIVGGAIFYMYCTQWRKFSVQFMVDDTEYYSQTVKIKNYVTGLTLPEKEGYTFEKWIDEDGNDWKSSPVKKSLKLTAKWRVKVTSVTLQFDGGSYSGKQKDVVNIEYDSIIDFNIPTKTGYDFMGWKINNNDKMYKNGNVWKRTESSLTLNAIWQLKTTVVTFDLQGGESSESSNKKNYTYGSAYSVLTNPTKQGYDFGGWYLGDELFIGGDCWDKEVSSFTVTAKWIPHEIKVSFALNGGNVGGETSISQTTYIYGEAIDSMVIPSKVGYLFEGWYFDQVKYKEGSLWDIDAKRDEYVILTAKWYIAKEGFVIKEDAEGVKRIVGIDYNTTLAKLTVPKTCTIDGVTYDVILNGELNLYDNGDIIQGTFDKIKEVEFNGEYNINGAIDSLKVLSGVEKLILPTNYDKKLSYLFGTLPETLSNVYISGDENNSYSSCLIFDETLICPLTTIPSGYKFANEKYIRFTNLTEISDNMFNNCRNLEGVVFDKTITKIGAHAFDGCLSLKQFNATVVGEVGAYAFYNCKNLERIDLTHITKIGRDAFKNVNAVNKTNGLYVVSGWIVGVEVSDGIKGTIKLSDFDIIYGISDYAFVECRNLTKIDISDTQISYLNNTMFVGCTTGLEIYGREVTLDTTPVSGINITKQDSITYKI